MGKKRSNRAIGLELTQKRLKKRAEAAATKKDRESDDVPLRNEPPNPPRQNEPPNPPRQNEPPNRRQHFQTLHALNDVLRRRAARLNERCLTLSRRVMEYGTVIGGLQAKIEDMHDRHEREIHALKKRLRLNQLNYRRKMSRKRVIMRGRLIQTSRKSFLSCCRQHRACRVAEFCGHCIRLAGSNASESARCSATRLLVDCAMKKLNIPRSENCSTALEDLLDCPRREAHFGMAGRIKTPTNQKLLTNVAVVRIKKCGKRFEIACYKNKVVNWRNRTEKDIDEVLQTATVFSNVSKGQVAKREELATAFGTEDQTEICKLILDKGDLQVSDKERQVKSESSFKEVANLIANMCVNPETKRAYSVAAIEKSLHDLHFSLKPNHSAKQQALEMIPKLRETMKIDRAEMRLRISVEAKEAKKVHDRVRSMIANVEVEDWDQGNLEIVGLIEPGAYRTIDELLRKEAKSTSRMELLSLKVMNEGDIEIA